MRSFLGTVLVMAALRTASAGVVRVVVRKIDTQLPPSDIVVVEVSNGTAGRLCIVVLTKAVAPRLPSVPVKDKPEIRKLHRKLATGPTSLKISLSCSSVMSYGMFPTAFSISIPNATLDCRDIRQGR